MSPQPGRRLCAPLLALVVLCMAAPPVARAGGPVQVGGAENRLCASSNAGVSGADVTNCSPPEDDEARDFSHSVSADTASATAELVVSDRVTGISIGTGGSLDAFGDGIGEGDDKQESGSARLGRAFKVTEAVAYRFAVDLSAEVGGAPFGDRGKVAVSLVGTESGSGETFVFSRGKARSTSVPDDTGSLSGTLEPGEYSFVVEASCQVASERCGVDWSVSMTLGLTDTDGDALPDAWETSGADSDGNGTIDVDLPGMGADPRHMDIFVELDFMAPHRLSLAAGNLVANAFADAPVTNPDGTTGIALHLDNGADSVMNPRTGALWGSLTRQSSIPHQDALGSITDGEYDWGPFDTLKDSHFPFPRRPVFHYAISAHGHDGTGSGIARDIPSSDLLVTLGAGCLAATGPPDCTLDPTAQAGTLMHELGHNLGLHHGGADDIVNKPNYLSVMNYSFQLTGLLKTSFSSFLDYSRFAISVDENALDETHGFGASGPAANLVTLGFCPSGAQTPWFVADGPTDFNCSGEPPAGTVASDINRDGTRTALAPFADWPALVFDGGAVGGSGAALPGKTPQTEPPLEELLASKKVLDDFVAAQQGTPTAPGPGPGPDLGLGLGLGTAMPVTPPAGTPLAVTSLAIRPGRFAAARRGPSVHSRGAATVSYALTRAARVRFTVERRLAGRRRGGRCRAPEKAPHGRPCVRLTTVRGRFSHTGASGVNRFRFSGRLASRKLLPGRYRLVALPIAPDGARGALRRAAFKIRR